MAFRARLIEKGTGKERDSLCVLHEKKKLRGRCYRSSGVFAW